MQDLLLKYASRESRPGGMSVLSDLTKLRKPGVDMPSGEIERCETIQSIQELGETPLGGEVSPKGAA